MADIFICKTIAVFITLNLTQGYWMQLTLGRRAGRGTLHHAEETPLICETHRQTSALASSRLTARLNSCWSYRLLKVWVQESNDDFGRRLCDAGGVWCAQWHILSPLKTGSRRQRLMHNVIKAHRRGQASTKPLPKLLSWACRPYLGFFTCFKVS